MSKLYLNRLITTKVNKEAGTQIRCQSSKKIMRITIIKAKALKEMLILKLVPQATIPSKSSQLIKRKLGRRILLNISGQTNSKR